MSRIPCEVMTAGIGEMLAGRFGKEYVVDVLQGTELEQYSKQFGFGLYVVKGAVETSLQEVWAHRCDRMMEAMGKQHGADSVRVVHSKKRKYHYAWVQGVVGERSCNYGYPGIQRQPLAQLDEGNDNESCGVCTRVAS